GAPNALPVDLGQDVGGGFGVVTAGAGVLVVLLDLDVHAQGLQGIAVRGDRAVTAALEGLRLPVELDLGGHSGFLALVMAAVDGRGVHVNRGVAVQVSGGDNVLVSLQLLHYS